MNQESTPVRIGIIGCGAVTQNNYAKTLPVIHGVSVTGVFDLNEANALKAADIFRANIMTPDRMRSETDVIVIATPPQSHVPLVKEALTAGKSVVCEKPFVGKRSDAEMLVGLAKERNAALYVAHFRRMFPQVQLVRSLSASGVFGPVTGLQIVEGGRFSWDAQSGYVMKDPMGGVLFDTGSHTIDSALFAANLDLGDFAVKLQSLKRDRSEPSHEIEASFSFAAGEGSGHAKVHFSRYRVLANKIAIIYERGRVEFQVGLSKNVRIVGPHGTSIVCTEREFSDYMEPFALQYRTILFGPDKEQFTAGRFINLTTVLETLANG